MQECVIYGNNVIDFCQYITEMDWSKIRNNVYRFLMSHSKIKIRIGSCSVSLLKKLMSFSKKIDIEELEIYDSFLFRCYAKLIVQFCQFVHLDKLVIKSSYSDYDIEPIFGSLPFMKITKLSVHKLTKKSLKLLSNRLQYTIRELHLPKCILSNNRMYYLSKALSQSKITHLYLNSNRIVLDGIVYLSRVLPLTNLVVLNLYGNRLGNSGISILSKYIPKCRTLRELGLSRTNIFSEGFKVLCYILPYTRITTLFVAQNFITQTDVEHVLVPILPKTFITKISWYGNMIEYHVQNEIHSGIKNILLENVKKQKNHNNCFQFKLFLIMLNKQMKRNKHFENNIVLTTLCDYDLSFCIEEFLKIP